MKFVGKSIDDGNLRGRGHLVKDALLIDASDNALNPALEVARDIGNGFAFAEPGLRVVKKDYMAAHTLNADFKSDASAKGRLFENERDKFAAQGVCIIRRIRFDIRGDRKEFSGVRRTPFRSREQIVR